jgi:AcrR family transcriptional regulator
VKPARRKVQGGVARSKAGTRRRLAPDERERQIVDAAIEFFAEVGFGGQTRELSRRLGITQPLLYRYFPSKQDLIERVYRAVYLGPWDPGWERLLDDRRIPLRERLIEFYLRYTAAIFNPQWLRIYLYSGLLGVGFNKRYLARLERRVLARICRELRHEWGLPSPARLPIRDVEMELVQGLQAAIFYHGVREHVYGIEVRPETARAIEIAVDALLEGAPRAMRRLVGGARVTSRGAPRRAAAAPTRSRSRSRPARRTPGSRTA